MRFKVGDKVKFLNEKGGGTITALMDNRVVKIATDDGFEMPVLANELIPDYRLEPDYDNIVKHPITTSSQNKPESELETSNISEINPWGKPKEEEGIYLVFEPHEQQWILTGDMDMLLINHTPFEIIYSLFLEQDGKLNGVDYNIIPPASKIVINTVKRDEVDNLTHGIIQILIHNDEPEAVYLPLNSIIDIRSGRFFKEGNYRQNTLINKKAIISVVALKSTFIPVGRSEHDRKTDSCVTTGKAWVKREKPFIDKHSSQQGEAIVDLHIGEIVDNIAGLSSHDMFMLQINYFRKAIESAISADYHKLTFIHGVGNGVLKDAIIKELKIYEQTEHYMASISKFGVGAIDVIIHNSEND